MVVAAVRLSLLTSVNDPLVPSGKVRLVLSGSGEAPSVVTALQLARQVFAPQLLALARQSRAQRTAKRFEAAFRQLLYDAAQVGRRALDPYAIEGKDVDAIVAAAMMAMVREFKALPDLLFAVLTAAGTSTARSFARARTLSNDCHDEKGQFCDTSGGGAAGGSADPQGDALVGARSSLAALPTHAHSEKLASAYGTIKDNPLQVSGEPTASPFWTSGKAEAEAATAGRDFGWQVRNGSVEEVDVSSLHSYQTWVGEKRVREHIDGGMLDQGVKTGPIATIVHAGGKDWIVDGNHRLSASKLLGRKKVTVVRIHPQPKATARHAAGVGGAILYSFSVLPEDVFKDPTERSAKWPAFAVELVEKEPTPATVRGAKTAFAFNVKDPRAVAWAKQHGAARVVEIGRETRKAIASVISRAQADGLNTRQQASLIRPLIGLTERDANAVYNRHETLILEGLDAEEALLEAATYADELLDARARTIARSETSEAAEEGQRQTWEQAVEEGYLPADVQRVWLATPLACPICQDMDGEAVGLDEPWTLPDGEETLNPQAHPNCTCSQGIA